MAEISSIAETIAAAIEATSAVVQPAVTFRQAHYQQPLVEQDAYFSPSDTSRTFHCLPLWDPKLSEKWRTGAGNPYWRQTVRVEIRYQIPREDKGVKTLHDMVASDVPLVLETVYETQLGADTLSRYVDLPATPSLELINEDALIYLLTLDFGVFYTRDTGSGTGLSEFQSGFSAGFTTGFK